VYQVWLKSLQPFESYAGTYIHTYIHTYTHTSSFIYIYIYIYNHICTKFGWNCSRRSRVMLEHIYINTYIHFYIYRFSSRTRGVTDLRTQREPALILQCYQVHHSNQEIVERFSAIHSGPPSNELFCVKSIFRNRKGQSRITPIGELVCCTDSLCTERSIETHMHMFAYTCVCM
jgi:hypothetical protein